MTGEDSSPLYSPWTKEHTECGPLYPRLRLGFTPSSPLLSSVLCNNCQDPQMARNQPHFSTATMTGFSHQSCVSLPSKTLPRALLTCWVIPQLLSTADKAPHQPALDMGCDGPSGPYSSLLLSWPALSWRRCHPPFSRDMLWMVLVTQV